MFKVSLLVDNAEVGAQYGRSFEVRNPISGEVVTKAAAASVQDAKQAADSAAAGFYEWSLMSPSARREVLLKAADILERKSQEASVRATAEMGATQMWGAFNAQLGAKIIREAAMLTSQMTGEVIPSDEPGLMAMAVRQPVGVVLSIAPWNAPIILGIRAIAMPLACGNSVVFKASELCPATHELLIKSLIEAGIPEGTVTMVTNAPEDAELIVSELIKHPAVRRVNFTGSTRVGKLIAKQCAEHLKPPLLELGGKAPMIVLDDADLNQAVSAAAFGAYVNQGQICMSTERLILTPLIADTFVDRLTEKVRGIRAGDPKQNSFILGALVNQAALERLNRLIVDAESKGASILVGGTSDSVLMDATLLDNVTSAMEIYREESFGPILSIIRANNEDDAIRIANDTEYGLAASVFTQNFNKGMEIAKRIESGICHINGPTVQDEAPMPFGGVKASGYGRFGSRASIQEFTELRWITNQSGERHYPF